MGAPVTAYSFKRRFVAPIQVGLGLEKHCHLLAALPLPKRQTIRTDRKRHARPGEELQLYCGMRTKGCFLIGRARCVSVGAIFIQFGREIVSVEDYPAIRDGDLDPFAQADGFENWEAMRQFWRNEHLDWMEFRGVIIKWEPIA